MNDAVTDPAAMPPGRRTRVVRLVLALAAMIQVVLLFYSFVMGLGWGGVGWVANLVQGASFWSWPYC